MDWPAESPSLLRIATKSANFTIIPKADLRDPQVKNLSHAELAQNSADEMDFPKVSGRSVWAGQKDVSGLPRDC